MRQWRRPPAHDATLAAQSRKYVSACVWVHVMVTRVFYANWPYRDTGAQSSCSFFYCHEAADTTERWTSSQVLSYSRQHASGTYSMLAVAIKIQCNRGLPQCSDAGVACCVPATASCAF